MEASADPLGRLGAPPVFVIGNGRSGTTWVYDLLTAHPEVAGIFESWLFGRGTGVRGLFHDSQWSPEMIELGKAKLGRRYGLNALGTREEMLLEVRDLATRWFARALEPGHRYLVEKTPDHLHAIGLIAEVFPEARFVHVLRDPRDVADSMRAAAAWNPGWAGRTGRRAIAAAAAEWNAEVPAGRIAGRALGDRYTEVRYEELKADTHAALERLFAFCGIEAGEAAVEAAVRANDFAGAHGSGAGEGSFRRRGVSGGWRTSLSLHERLAVERHAGAAMRDLGYERSRTWWLAPGRSR